MTIKCIDTKVAEPPHTTSLKIGAVDDGYWAYLQDNNELILFEWKTYEITAEDAEIEIEGLQSIQQSPTRDGTYIFSFKNYVGKSTLTIKRRDGKRCQIPIIVLSEKIGEIPVGGETIHLSGINSVDEAARAVERVIRKFGAILQKMTDDIARISAQLNFTLYSPTEFAVEESDHEISTLFAYHYLRSNKERIESAFENTLRRLKRKLVVEEAWLEPFEVSEVGPETVISIAEHPEYLVRSGSSNTLAKELRGYIPRKVRSFKKHESFDVPENRFVKHFLQLLITWGARAVETFEKTAPGAESVLEVLETLEFIESASFWAEIGNMTAFPFTSQTLLKGDGYRDLLELYREFTAYVPFFGDLENAIYNKDIAKLYEYWCYFKLIEKLEKILGKAHIIIRITPAGELSEKGDVYARFENGWRLYYNKKLGPKKWSYSVTLRPDFALFDGPPYKGNSQLLGVFDAKFKLDVISKMTEAESFDAENEKAEHGNQEMWAKVEDIYKMHTYRDALNAKFAVVLYPGQRSIFFDTTKQKHIFELDALLDKDKIKLKGVGYLKMVPEVEKVG